MVELNSLELNTWLIKFLSIVGSLLLFVALCLILRLLYGPKGFFRAAINNSIANVEKEESITTYNNTNNADNHASDSKRDKA